jgi:hypothetical protein
MAHSETRLDNHKSFVVSTSTVGNFLLIMELLHKSIEDYEMERKREKGKRMNHKLGKARACGCGYFR